MSKIEETSDNFYEKRSQFNELIEPVILQECVHYTVVIIGSKEADEKANSLTPYQKT